MFHMSSDFGCCLSGRSVSRKRAAQRIKNQIQKASFHYALVIRPCDNISAVAPNKHGTKASACLRVFAHSDVEGRMATEQSKTLLKYEPRLSDEHRSRLLQSGVGNDLYSRLLSLSTTLEAVSSALDDASRSTLQTDLYASREQRSHEYDELLSAVLVKSGLTTLSITLDRVLNEALQAEQELDWWRRVESSVWNTMYYLLQSKYP